METNIPKFECDRVEDMGPHMRKYYLSNGWVVHRFTHPDTGDYHDHPFNFTTTILYGGYVEQVAHALSSGSYYVDEYCRLAGTTRLVLASTVHIITSLCSDECWTVIEPEQEERKPGFYRFTHEGIFHRYWDQSEFTLISKKHNG